MATYAELFDLRHDSGLMNKITIAVGVAARDIQTTTSANALRKTWAVAAFADPSGEAKRMFTAVLVANRTMTVEQIRNATDEAIQTAVDAAVELFAGA